MSYYVKREEIYNAQKIMLTKTNSWLEQLADLKSALSLMAGSDAIEGATADSIQAYINEEPLVIVDSLSACIQYFQAHMMVCANGYVDIDSSNTAKIRNDRLKNISQSLNTRNNSFYNTREAVIRKLYEVSDIFYASAPSNTVYYDIENLRKSLEELETEVTDYESEHIRDMDDINNILSALGTVINAALTRTAVKMTTYGSGVIPSGRNVQVLAYSIGMAQANVSNDIFQSQLKKAGDDYKARIEEELAEARKDKGIEAVLTGVAAVVAGAACIVATWGAATPVVVGAFAVGGTAIGFGVAESVEGAQDIYYGSKGDLDSYAFNPLRDTVFASNPDLYYTVGTISTTASVVIAGGAGLANVGAGLLAEGATTGQAIGGMAIEAGKMVGSSAAGAGVSKLIYDWTGDRVLSTIAGAGVGIATYGLANHFFDTDSIVGVSGNQTVTKESASFIDEMSVEDKAKYQQFWDDVGNGIDPETRVKLNQWNQRPDSKLYVEYAKTYDNSAFFNQETGAAIYPDNNGFLNGVSDNITLQPGTIIDRYGSGSGQYFSPNGVSFVERALPPYMKNSPYTRYEVVYPFSTEAGTVAPWFDQPGGGIQFYSELSADELVDLGFLRVIK